MNRQPALSYCRSCGTRLARDNTSDHCAPCESKARTLIAEPPHVPSRFWDHPTMRTAVVSRHMGCVIRAYRHHPFHGRPLPQGAVGAWMGITQVQVSRIENGRPIVHLDQLIHCARTLRIPQEHLWFKLPGEIEPHQPAASAQPEFAALGHAEEVSVTALHNALLRAVPTPANRVIPDPDHEDLEQRVLDAWAARSRTSDHRPLLVVVGGFAGCGKTEFGRFLSGVTGWTHLDKDVLTRPLVESLLASLDADPNDRHTELYLRQVRPVEYRCLLSATFNNLDNGVSTILTAPFLQEMPDFSWLQRLRSRCIRREVDVAVIWVDADVEAMYTYLQARDAARDTWKLNHWDDYLASIDLNLRPSCPHFVVDNRQNAALDLGDQAQRLAGLVHYHR